MAGINNEPQNGENEITSAEEKKRIKEEQKRLKKEQKKLGKEMRAARAMEDDTDDDSGSILGIVLVIIFIVLIWLVLLFLAIRLDVGGFGTNIVKPLIKDVDALQFVLPPTADENASLSENDADKYVGYEGMADAVARVKELELTLKRLEASEDDGERKEEVQAEIKRLQEFEAAQTSFEALKNKYYEEVVFSNNPVDIQAYQSYYDEIDDTTAEDLYRQVAKQVAYADKLSDYAKAYSAMKPTQAAKIFEAMQDDMYLVALILNQMSADDRGNILAAMDTSVAAQLTEIMDPDE